MIEQALIISLIVLFTHASTWEGHINYWIREFIHPDWYWSKPIYNCPMCMTPYWGTALYVLFYSSLPTPFSAFPFKDWFLTIFTASGFSTIWVIFISLREAAVEYKKSK